MGSSKAVTIGYQYFMGMHQIICHGPVDEVEEIFVGERSAWTGAVTSSQQIFVDSPNLFGGAKKEGGVQGFVDIEFGDGAQGPNSYLQTHLGADIPAFRGLLGFVLHQCYVTAMSRYPKKWAARVKRAPARSWYDAKAEIAGDGGDIPGGSANGAHIIYEALTNVDWGLGLPSNLLNDTSFRDTADSLFTENFGLSLLFSQQSKVEEFIQIILAHISAVLYVDRTTGQFTLKLVREPTAPELSNAIIFDESNTDLTNSFQRPSFAEMINEVVIKYRPQGTLKDSAITLQDLGAIQSQIGNVSQTVHFPGIDNAEIASRVGIREIRQYSTPLAKIRITVNRDGWEVNPGDIIKYSSTEYGVSNLVVRVFSVNYGTLVKGKIIIDGTEDIYALPQTSYLTNQPSGWTDPVQAAQAVTIAKLEELPYYEIANNFSPGDIATFDQFTAFLQIMAVNPPIATPSYQLWLSPDNTAPNHSFDIDGSYTPSVEISQNMDIPTNDSDQIISVQDFTGAFSSIGLNTYAYLNDEVLQIIDIDFGLATIELRRGVLDSVPQTHSIGDRIYFTENEDTQATPEYFGDPTIDTGDTTYARLLVQTDIDTLDVASAPQESFTFNGRQSRPLPPTFMKIESLFFPAVITQLVINELNTTWNSRDRLLQITSSLNHFYTTDDVNAPEENSRFQIQFLSENDELLTVRDIVGTLATSYLDDYPGEDEVQDSGLFFFANRTVIDTLQSTPISIYEASLVTSANRTRSDKGIGHTDKVYAEFVASDDDFYVGLSNESSSYSSSNTTNIAYLRVSTNTLVGQVTGTIGTGTLHGGIAGIAIDLINEKFWLRNINGTWRDGDPATNTGGFDYSTLTYDGIYFAVANDVNETTEVNFNYGQNTFEHTIPSGFIAYQPPTTSTVLIDDINIGSLLTLSADFLTVDGSAASGSTWRKFKASTTAIKTEGRWYYEAKILRLSDQIGDLSIGVSRSSTPLDDEVGSGTNEVSWSPNGDVLLSNSAQTPITTYGLGDSVGVSFDANIGTINFYKNGVQVGGPYSVTVNDLVPSGSIRQRSSDVRMLFNVEPPDGYSSLNVIELDEDLARLNDIITVELKTIREDTISGVPTDIDSRQTVSHSLERAGWGYRYGEYYGGI